MNGRGAPASRPCRGSAPTWWRWSASVLLAWGALAHAQRPAEVPALAGAACAGWPAWETYKQHFLSDDGRVIDPASPRKHTTSESQAYALFFALVANDRSTFERLLKWTEDNLAAGDLGARLPAWQWGRRDDGTWQVVDANAASDADLWMVYALGEAGRLWGQRRYLALASLLAAKVLREEVAVLPGLGPTLLPGPVGFGPKREGRRLTARLNPSYLPLPVLRWLAQRSGAPIWAQILASSAKVIEGSAPKGFAGDWVQYEAEQAQDTASSPSGSSREPFQDGDFLPGRIGPASDADQRLGSYDAIRVYLWLGMTSPADPLRSSLLRRLSPMADWIEQKGVPPEHIDPVSLSVRGDGPSGFSAAALPFLAALARKPALVRQQQRLQLQPPRDHAYFEQSLALFGQGFMDERYRFDSDGTLLPAWTSCTKLPLPSR